MAKSKNDKKMKKPKTIAEFRKLQNEKKRKAAKKMVSQEKLKETIQQQERKKLTELSAEQEKILGEKRKKLGMADQLRELYPELSDTDFNKLLKSQFGITVPIISGIPDSGIIEPQKRGGRRTRAQIENFNERIRDGSKEDLMNMLEQGDFSQPEIRQINVKLKQFQLREKTQAEDERQQLIRAQEEELKSQEEQKIQKRIKKETEQSRLLKAREEEEKAQKIQSEIDRKKAMDDEEKKRQKLQKETLKTGEKSTKKISDKLKGLEKQKELKEKERFERELEQQYKTDEEKALRKKIEEGFKPPKEVFVQNPNQAIQQAQEDENLSQLPFPIEGQGLLKRYALHPSHIKDSKDKYVISKAGQKHIKLLKNMLKPADVDYILHFSLLNKARNDKLGLSKKFNGRKVKGYKKTTKGGSVIYTKI